MCFNILFKIEYVYQLFHEVRINMYILVIYGLCRKSIIKKDINVYNCTIFF